MGPSVGKIGQVASMRVPGQSKELYLWESIVYPDRFKASSGVMPGGFAEVLNDSQLRDLVAFLSGLGSTTATDYRSILAMSKPQGTTVSQVRQTLSLEKVKRGQALFAGKFRCSTCHSAGEAFQGSTLLGPSLSSVGLYDAETLRRAIRDPSKEIHPGYIQVKGLLEDGTVVTGKVIRKTDSSITLMSPDSTGGMVVQEYALAEFVENPDGEKLVQQVVSMMPKWDSEAMSEEELECLVDFLKVLRG